MALGGKGGLPRPAANAAANASSALALPPCMAQWAAQGAVPFQSGHSVAFQQIWWRFFAEQ